MSQYNVLKYVYNDIISNDNVIKYKYNENSNNATYLHLIDNEITTYYS